MMFRTTSIRTLVLRPTRITRAPAFRVHALFLLSTRIRPLSKFSAYFFLAAADLPVSTTPRPCSPYHLYSIG
eukprot:1308252-Pleurochrysis_carterae.AAC.1